MIFTFKYMGFNLEIGMLLKKPKGRVIYELTRFAKHRFGDIELMNIETKKKYIYRSTDNWIQVILIKPRKKIKTFKFN